MPHLLLGEECDLTRGDASKAIERLLASRIGQGLP